MRGRRLVAHRVPLARRRRGRPSASSSRTACAACAATGTATPRTARATASGRSGSTASARRACSTRPSSAGRAWPSAPTAALRRRAGTASVWFSPRWPAGSSSGGPTPRAWPTAPPSPAIAYGSERWLATELCRYLGDAVLLEPEPLRARVAERARELAALLREHATSQRAMSATQARWPERGGGRACCSRRPPKPPRCALSVLGGRWPRAPSRCPRSPPSIRARIVRQRHRRPTPAGLDAAGCQARERLPEQPRARPGDDLGARDRRSTAPPGGPRPAGRRRADRLPHGGRVRSLRGAAGALGPRGDHRSGPGGTHAARGARRTGTAHVVVGITALQPGCAQGRRTSTRREVELRTAGSASDAADGAAPS